MSYTKTFGRKEDGTLEICRAKPENRGKGRCPHSEHFKIHSKKLEQGFIQKYNENVLSQDFKSVESYTGTSDYPNVSEDLISTHKGGAQLTKEELLEGAEKISEHINEEDWEFVQSFSNIVNDKILEDVKNQRFGKISGNIAAYLKSDDETAKKTREFLGKEINIDEFSDIITHQVRAMTKAEKWRPNRTTNVARIVFTTLDNDMTKERYIASVMFFGGRCCYCNRVLTKNPPSRRQASGEHLTPVSPNDPNAVHGGTRYGNMALACVRCNNSRGSQELVSWIQETNCIPAKNKQAVLGRIQAFRKFTLYHEYSQEENDRILVAIDKLNKKLQGFRERNGGDFSDEDFNNFKKELSMTLYELKHS